MAHSSQFRYALNPGDDAAAQQMKPAQGAERTATPLINRLESENKPVSSASNCGDKSAQTAESQSQAEYLPGLKIVHKGETVRETINIDGQDRDYLVHVPKNYDECKPAPLVVAMHGYGRTRGQGDTDKGASGFEEVSGFSKKADEENFVVVYPDGNPESSYSFNNDQWWFSKTDDSKFIRGILENVTGGLNIDRERMYLAGYSQGASFGHKIANELSDKIAAFAELGGWMTGKETPGSSPFSVLAIQADHDTTAPPSGRFWWLTMKPEQYTTNFYRNANHIETPIESSFSSGLNGTTVRQDVSFNPSNKTEVRTMWLQTNSHHWYNGKGDEGAAINATDEMWNFLKRFKKHSD